MTYADLPKPMRWRRRLREHGKPERWSAGWMRGGAWMIAHAATEAELDERIGELT